MGVQSGFFGIFDVVGRVVEKKGLFRGNGKLIDHIAERIDFGFDFSDQVGGKVFVEKTVKRQGAAQRFPVDGIGVGQADQGVAVFEFGQQSSRPGKQPAGPSGKMNQKLVCGTLN